MTTTEAMVAWTSMLSTWVRPNKSDGFEVGTRTL